MIGAVIAAFQYRPAKAANSHGQSTRLSDGNRAPVMARDDGLDLVAASLNQIPQRGRPQVGHGHRVRPTRWRCRGSVRPSVT